MTYLNIQIKKIENNNIIYNLKFNNLINLWENINKIINSNLIFG